MDYPLPGNAAIILTQTDVHPGDVLLGHSEIMAGESQSQPLGYSHVAIALSDGNVLDASSSGVRIIKLDHLLDEYEHLAVLTATETWGRSLSSSLSIKKAKNLICAVCWAYLKICNSTPFRPRKG